MVMAPVVRGRKGEYEKLLEQIRLEGYSRGRGRRRAAPARRGDRARQEVQARHLGRRRPAGDEAGPAPPALGVGRGGGGAGRRGRRDRRAPRAARRGQGASPARASRERRAPAAAGGRRRAPDLLRALRLPQLRHLDPRARAADLLLQLAPRRLRALPRARLPAGDRPRAGRPRPDAVARRGGAAALAARPLALLEAPGRGGGRGLRRRRRHALAGALRRGARDLPLRHRRASATRSATRTASGAGAPTAVRFEGIVNNLERRYEETDSERVRERVEGYMAEQPCPDCKRRPAAAGEPRGEGRRDQHRTSTRELSARAAREWIDEPRDDRHRAGDRAADRPRDHRAARLPRQRRHRLPDAGADRPARSRAARRSGSGSRPRSARAWSACSTSSTSRRSACTSATTRS